MKTGKPRYYTDLETKAVIENYFKGKSFVRELLPNRNWESIKEKARELGLYKKRPWKWKPEEVEFLKNNFSKSSKEISNRLGIPVNSINWKRKKLCCQRGNCKDWTFEEYEKLKKLNQEKPVSDILKEFTDRTESAVLTKLYKIGRPQSQSHRLFTMNQDCFDEWTKESAYWIGFISADGGLSVPSERRITIGLSVRDRGHLVKLANFCGMQEDRIHTYMQRKFISKSNEPKVAVLNIVSEKIYNRFIENGIHPRKTYKLDFPSQLPDEFLSSFILGYFDGDGSLSLCRSADRYRYPFLHLNILGIKEFLDGLKKRTSIKFPCLKVGLHSKNYINVPLYSIRLSHKKAEEFMKWLYEGQPVYLDRKHDVYIRYLEEKKKYYNQKSEVKNVA